MILHTRCRIHCTQCSSARHQGTQGTGLPARDGCRMSRFGGLPPCHGASPRTSLPLLLSTGSFFYLFFCRTRIIVEAVPERLANFQATLQRKPPRHHCDPSFIHSQSLQLACCRNPTISDAMHPSFLFNTLIYFGPALGIDICWTSVFRRYSVVVPLLRHRFRIIGLARAQNGLQ
jgi:hypothetical protein